MKMTKDKTVKEQFAETMEQAGNYVLNFPWSNNRAYGLWLTQTYHFVRHSSRLLALGAASATLSEDSLHRRMINHLKEEIGHDKVAASDLNNLGLPVGSFPEFATTKAFYQNQYYYLQNRMAPSFLGWILFLEGVAAKYGPIIYERTVNAFGPKCTHFVKLHAEEDQDHIEKALALTNDFNPREAEEVIENMKLSAELYRLMLAESAQLARTEVQPFTANAQPSETIFISEPASM